MKSDSSNSQQPAKSRHLSVLIRILVGVAILYFVFRDLEWDKVRSLLLQLKPLIVAAAVMIFVLCQMIVSLRWWLLLRSQHVHITILSAIRLNFLGLFYNNFLPSSIGGDLVRAWYVTKHTTRRFEAALSVPVDRMIGLVAICVLAFVSWGAFLNWEKLELGQGYAHVAADTIRSYDWAWKAGIAAIVATVLLVVAVGPLRRRLQLFAAAAARRGRGLLQRLSRAGLLYLRSPITLITTVLLTLGSQSLVVLAFWLIGRGMGINAEFKYYMVFFPLSWVLGAIPISVAGAGLVEGWLVLLFSQNAGISPEAALALALCQRVIWMLASMPGLVIYLTGGHLPRDFSVDYGKPLN